MSLDAGLPLQSHVRVVVRTQPREELLLRSLIYSLRAQALGHSWLTLDFVLVPTEPGSLPVYETLRQGTWREGRAARERQSVGRSAA